MLKIVCDSMTSLFFWQPDVTLKTGVSNILYGIIYDKKKQCTNIWQIKNFGCTFQFNKIVCVWQKCIFIWLHSKICYCLQLSQCFRNWLYLFCLVRWLYIWSLESPLWNYSVSHCDLTNFFCSFFRAKAAHQQFAWRHEGRSLDYLPTTQQQQV